LGEFVRHYAHARETKSVSQCLTNVTKFSSVFEWLQSACTMTFLFNNGRVRILLQSLQKILPLIKYGSATNSSSKRACERRSSVGQVSSFADPTQFCVSMKRNNHWSTLILKRDSSVGIAARYELGGPAIESRLRRAFPHASRPALKPT
jgi:hypothetical protein